MEIKILFDNKKLDRTFLAGGVFPTLSGTKSFSTQARCPVARVRMLKIFQEFMQEKLY